MINIDTLKSLHERLLALRKNVSNEKVNTISRKSIREEAEQIGSYWFSGLADELSALSSLKNEIIQDYSTNFSRLIKISAP
ncbi:MAG: hypothetical protein NTU73_15245, partial [Ignavibacteriae bacterium]|nr:hypothetical protein [Ignavibacteriota bacterium]